MGRIRCSLIGALFLTACHVDEPSTSVEPLSPVASELAFDVDATRVAVGPGGVAYEFARLDSVITSVAGDRSIVFVAEPLQRQVSMVDRVTGRPIGSLTPPPGGFQLPFIVRVARPGRLVVLDAGGLPGPTPTQPARVYDFNYRRRPGGVEVTLARTVSFEGLPVIFTDDVEVTPSGQYVVAESIVGALWVIEPDGSVRPGVFPSDGVPIASLAPCTIPDAVVDGITFRAPGNFGPGVQSLATRDGQLYFAPTCQGGVFALPLASLSDGRTPAQRAADIRPVSPRQGTSETIHGLAFNDFDADDPYLYASDSFRLQVIRIDVRTGARTVVAADPVLFNFPSKLQFLPPLVGDVAPLVVASDQEHRLPLINAALDKDLTQPPWIVTKVIVRR